jgi:hypothetical protein
MAKKRKSTIYQLSQKTEAPATQGKNYPATARVPSLDEIYDEETNTNRMIRYVIGEPSIFEDEQTSDKPVLGDIVFTNGILPVPYNQATLKKYLDTSNYNGGNPNRIEDKRVLFQAIDNEFDAQKSMKDMEIEYLATDTLMKLDAQKMVGYARAMGLDVDRSMYEIKHDMMVMAKGNPKLFMEEISNPMIERKQVIMDAIDEMIVIELKGKRQFVWGDSKELIFTVPVGVDVIDALTEYTFDDEGTSVFSRIKRLMSKEDVIKTKTETKTKKVEKFVN